MFVLILFSATLHSKMDSEALNNSGDSQLVKNNASSLKTVIKCKQNVNEDATPGIDKSGNQGLVLRCGEISFSNDIPNVKNEKLDDLNNRPVDTSPEAIHTQNPTCSAISPGENHYFKSESDKKIEEKGDKLQVDLSESNAEEVLMHAEVLLSNSNPNEILRMKKKWNELWDEPVEIPSGLSKSQKKKYIRKVLWETKWKPLKRAKEKEKLKQKKLQARLNNETLGPSRKKLKHCTMATSKCKLRIVLDFSFDDLMSEKDLGKCLKQLNHCYCLNRRATNPLQLYVSNFCGPARDQLARGVAYENWDMNFSEDSYLNMFKKDELVYLTSDSDNTLSQLDHSKVYIIGALVDHNKYKGKTLEVAKKQEINHAKLPISDFLQMNSRTVLTIDHVFEILIHASTDVSWKDSFLRVLPQRKGAVEKLT